MLAEQHDEWTEMRRYIGLEVLAKARAHATPEPDPTMEVTPEALTA